MLIEKALDILKRLRIGTARANVDGDKVYEPLSIAIESLEKQLPKEVINKQTNYVKFCPVCKSALLRERDIYCSDCGQKLKWD